MNKLHNTATPEYKFGHFFEGITLGAGREEALTTNTNELDAAIEVSGCILQKTQITFFIMDMSWG